MGKEKTLKNSINSRILLLKTHLKLGQTEFCQQAEISFATYHKIRNDEPLRERTVRNIAKALNANEEYLFTGEGEMLIPTKKDAVALSVTEKMYTKLIEQLDHQTKLVDRLTQIILNLGGPGGGKVNFLEVFNNAGFPSKSNGRLLETA